jgi:hypothetical protein
VLLNVVKTIGGIQLCLGLQASIWHGFVDLHRTLLFCKLSHKRVRSRAAVQQLLHLFLSYPLFQLAKHPLHNWQLALGQLPEEQNPAIIDLEQLFQQLVEHNNQASSPTRPSAKRPK